MVMILGMNGIAVARNGPILWENDATGSRKVFRGFRGFWEAIKKTKIAAKVREFQNTVFYRIFIYKKLPINRPGGLYVITERNKCR